MATYYGHLVPEFGDRMDPNVLGLIEKGFALSAVDYKMVEKVRTELWNRMRPILAENQAMLTPTMATEPITASIADWAPDDTFPAARSDDRYYSPDMTAVWNLISPCPALSVPCGLTPNGLPVGAQIIGRRWQSDTVLRIGAAIESGLAPIGRPLT